MSQEDEVLLATCGMGDDSHREPVTQIMWLQDPEKPSKYVVSKTGILQVEMRRESCNI